MRGQVRIITLARPDKRNALNRALCEALLNALQEADAEEAVRAVVLTGEGAGFCAGADLAERQSLAGDAAAREARAALSTALLQAPGAMGNPVVAAVHGAAMGAGASLALACDMIVAADDLRFAYPEAKHGILPRMVAPMLIRHLGPKDAFDLLATGRVVGAQEAIALRLACRAVPKDRLLETACAVAENAALLPPDAMRALKALVNATGCKP